MDLVSQPFLCIFSQQVLPKVNDFELWYFLEIANIACEESEIEYVG